MKMLIALSLFLPTLAWSQICPENVDVVAPKLQLESGYGKNTKEFPTQFIYGENLKKADIDLKDNDCFNRQFKQYSKQISKDYQFDHIEIYENVSPVNPNQRVATFIVEYYDDSRTDQFLEMSESHFDENAPTASIGRPADYVCYARIQFECALMDARKIDQSPRKKGPKEIGESDKNSEGTSSSRSK